MKIVKLSLLLILVCFTNITAQNNNHNGRNDSWGIVGIGGGGAMFNQTVCPHNPNDIFLNCDMGGAYVSHNAGKSWRMFNLNNQISFFAFDPVNPKIVYANGLGLYKSLNNGDTWQLIYPNPSEVDGFISIGDHAENAWLTKDATNQKVLALAIDPSNSDKLVAAVKIEKTTSLLLSNDGGKTWNKDIDLENGVKNIFIDPTSPKNNRTIYVAGSFGILQKTNGIWQKNERPKGVNQCSFFTAGFDQKTNNFIIYTISGQSYYNSKTDQSGIFITKNGGKTWENRQDGILAYGIKKSKLPEWQAIGTSAFHPNVVYVSYKDFQTHKDTISFGVAKSTDFGKTWKLVWKDPYSSTTKKMKADWLTERYGPGWGENPFSLGVSPTNPNICYGGDFGRTMKTDDGGKTWGQVNSTKNANGDYTTTGLEVTTSYTIAFDPFDKNHVYIPTTDIGLMESYDGTRTWHSATKNNGVPEKWVNTTYWLTFDPEVKGKAWAVMAASHDLPRPKMFRGTNDHNTPSKYKGGILQTNDSGKTWSPVSTAIGEGAFTFILVDPKSNKEARILYATAFGKGVYKSIDDGKTWTPKNNGITQANPFAWQITRRDDGALFLIVSRSGEDTSVGVATDGAIYKSVDDAENWTKINLPEGANAPTSLAFNDKKPEQLLISTWGIAKKGQLKPDTGGGIFLSNDEGKTWTPVLDKDQHIGAVTFDKRNGRYYACGFESSAYYSEDNGATWNRIKGYNFKWGQRVEPDPFDAEKIYINTFGGGVWHGPAKGDAKAVEDIIKN